MIKNFRLRKSVAGKPVHRMSYKPHFVTPVGTGSKKRYTPFIELVDTESGVRHKLISMGSRGAKLIRQMVELNAIDQIKERLSVQPGQVGDDKFQVLGVQDGDTFVPAFRVGDPLGVNNTFRDNVIEALNSKRSINTLDAVIVAAANKLGITSAELVGKRPSPFPEFEESGYGARFNMCSVPVAKAYKACAAKLKK